MFFLDPPQPTTMHNFRVKDTSTGGIEFLSACSLLSGEGVLYEEWITRSMVEGGAGNWEVEIVT